MVLFQIVSTADTLIVRQVPVVRSLFEQVVFVASGLTSILVLLLLLALLVALGALRSKAKETRRKIDDLLAELRPLATSATAMFEDVREVTAAANEIVDDSRDTVRSANRRVRRTVRGLTERVDEMSAIIGRVNRSAERAATVASATLGGIKLGAKVLGFGRRKKKRVRAEARAAERERMRARDGESEDAGSAERPRVRRRD